MIDRIADFTGFYPSKPYWAGSSIDLTDQESLNNFTDLMSEEIFEKEHNGIIVKVCRDGLILIKVDELERLIEKLPGTSLGEALERE